jgi:acyl-CoA thioester hydrolase
LKGAGIKAHLIIMTNIDLKELKLSDYPFKSYDKIRYGDTDRQQHVNNAVFSTFVETGRVELIFNTLKSIIDAGASFVIASLKLDMIAEITWPGTVDIGTGIIHVGNSSMRLVQCVYQNDRLVATAESVVVQTDELTRKSKPMSDETKQKLEHYIMRF